MPYINAEDADKNFMPCPGTIDGYVPPGGPGVRLTAICIQITKSLRIMIHLWENSSVGEKQGKEARIRMLRALDEYAITGVKTTIPFHQKILKHPKFVQGDFNTSFIPRIMNK